MNKTRVKQIIFFVEVINSLNDKYRGKKEKLGDVVQIYVCRLPFAVNVTLNFSNISFT